MTQSRRNGLWSLFRPTVKKPDHEKGRKAPAGERRPVVDVVALLKENTQLKADNAILRRRVEWYEERHGKVQA